MQNNRKSLFVSIVGKPNVGKSSMLNMIVNSKISIVSPKPQTTRNKITGILTQDNVLPDCLTLVVVWVIIWFLK